MEVKVRRDGLQPRADSPGLGIGLSLIAPPSLSAPALIVAAATFGVCALALLGIPAVARAAQRPVSPWTAIAWGGATVDGKLYHARNLALFGQAGHDLSPRTRLKDEPGITATRVEVAADGGSACTLSSSAWPAGSSEKTVPIGAFASMLFCIR